MFGGLFGSIGGAGGFTSSSGANAATGDVTLGGLEFGGINNAPRGIDPWVLVVAGLVVAYLVIKK